MVCMKWHVTEANSTVHGRLCNPPLAQTNVPLTCTYVCAPPDCARGGVAQTKQQVRRGERLCRQPPLLRRGSVQGGCTVPPMRAGATR